MGTVPQNHSTMLQICKIQRLILNFQKEFLIDGGQENILQHILGQNKRQILKENILPTVELNIKYLRNTIIRD